MFWIIQRRRATVGKGLARYTVVCLAPIGPSARRPPPNAPVAGPKIPLFRPPFPNLVPFGVPSERRRLRPTGRARGRIGSSQRGAAALVLAPASMPKSARPIHSAGLKLRGERQQTGTLVGSHGGPLWAASERAAAERARSCQQQEL
mgnify:CR=1 FL=1